MQTRHRAVEQIIEEQARRWEMLRKKKREEAPSPRKAELAIAISRLPGCSSREIAREIADRRKFDLFDKEIMQKVAENSHLSAALLGTLDERTLSWAEELVAALTMPEIEVFFRQLSKVLLALAYHGNAVILGRGAGFLIPHDKCLRVMLVAPLEARIENIARKYKLSSEEAKRRVLQVDSERRGYVRKYFHADMLDPTSFDIVLNTADLSIGGASAAIHAAWEDKSRPPLN
jgi:cytidylate kinase